MAFFRGEEGSVNFKNASGTTEAVVSTTGWTLDTTKDTLDVTAHGATSRSFVGSSNNNKFAPDFKTLAKCTLFLSPPESWPTTFC